MATESAKAGTDLAFSCRCGTVAGMLIDVGPANGDHVVCHCGDCQNFAHHLGAADHILGRYGGTDLYQGRCAKMRLVKGADQLSCLHLTDKPTLRWFASCCRTPMFNTYANGRIPYVTALLANFDQDQVKAMIGPVAGHLFLPDEDGILPDAPRMAMSKLMRRFFKRMVRDMLSGDRRRSALFDAITLEPISQPHRLTQAERSALP